MPEPPPFQIGYLWSWFLELHIGRHFGFSGAQPISYEDMLAWSQLTGRKLTPFDIETIRKIDQRFFYALRTPDGPLPQHVDRAAKAAEQSLAAAMRGMSKRAKLPEGEGLAELKVPPRIQSVPVITRSKNG